MVFRRFGDGANAMLLADRVTVLADLIPGDVERDHSARVGNIP
jgi:hypothetical protein